MRNIAFLLMLFMFCSCSDSDKQMRIVIEFPTTGELKAEVVTVPVSFLAPRYMGISGDNLLIHKVREEKLFSIYSLPDLTYVADAGVKGQGPNDFNLLDTRSFQMTEYGFKVIDANLNMLKDVEIVDNGLSVKESKLLFGQGVASNGFYPMGQGCYVAFTQPDSDKEFAIYDENSGEFSLVECSYPHWQELPKDMPAFMAYLKTCVAHPDGRRFAAFYGRYKRWRLFDDSMKLIGDIDVRIAPHKADATLVGTEQPTYYIGQPYATDKYIYVLCSNKNTDKDGRSELQVWDWEGNPVACYTFDRKLSLMAVCEKYNRIYGVDNLIENQIFVYNLSMLD